MNDLDSLNNLQLLKLQRTFEYGTDEWWEIQGILLYRRWIGKHGQSVADQMRAQWLSLNYQRQQFDRWYGQQLELDL